MRVTQLKLSHFRNLAALNLSVPPDAAVVALVGPNGAGKTSVLEALSLLSPTRGLLGADLKSQIQAGKSKSGIWAEAAGHEIGQQLARAERTLQIDTQKQPLEKLPAIGSVVWLTPHTDFLFTGAPATRRRWLDDAAIAFIPAHAQAVQRFRQHRQARLKLLTQPSPAAPDWIDAEEKLVAEWGLAVLQNRLAYLEALTPFLQNLTLALAGGALEILQDPNPVMALKGKLERAREIDARLERTHAGPNTLDVGGTLTLEDGARITLAQASSGQHKRGLLAWLMAHVQLLSQKRDKPPLVLIDEFSAHLDAPRRELLLAALQNLGCQTWLTDTETPPLANLHTITLPQ